MFSELDLVSLAALKVVVYCLPLIYTSIGLRSAVYLPLLEFPWYAIATILGFAIAFSAIDADRFSHQRDRIR